MMKRMKMPNKDNVEIAIKINNNIIDIIIIILLEYIYYLKYFMK